MANGQMEFGERHAEHEFAEVRKMFDLLVSTIVEMRSEMSALSDAVANIQSTADQIQTEATTAGAAVQDNAAAVTALSSVQTTLETVLTDLQTANATTSAPAAGGTAAAPTAPTDTTGAVLPAGAVGTDAAGNPVDATGAPVAAPTA